jgi:glycosyltransferase 2 family protein
MRNSEKSMNRKRMEKGIRIGGTILSSVLFIYLLYTQNWVVTWHELQQVPPWLWPLSLALVICGMLLNALRWYSLLRVQQVQISFIETTKIVFSGAFASNFLPSTIGGDAYRMVALLRYTPDKVLSVTSVVVDRGMNVLAMLTMLPFVVYTFGSTFNLVHLQGSRTDGMQALPLIAGVLTFLTRLKDRFFQTAGVWLKKPASLLVAFFISWWSIFVVYLGVWLIALSLGIPVQLYQVMGVSAAAYLITMLPISVNGYGLREFTVTALYMQLGATLEQASTLALIMRFFSLVETLPGALWLTQIVPVDNETTISEAETPAPVGKGE